MSCVTLLSDFGYKDHYTAVVKAALLCQSPAIQTIDISHGVALGNIAQAGLLLKAVWRDFPLSTVHLISLQDANSAMSGYIAVQADGHYFVSADSGLLSIIGLSAIEKIVVLPELAPEKKCFPEKYLLAPVAARLAMGEPIESVGVVRETFVTKIAKQTFVSGGDLRGSVVAIDHYGNLITDIDQTSFISFVGNEKFIINFGREKITRLSYQYTEVDFGDCLVMFNSAGLLEIAIRYGNAAELLGLGYGNAVIVSKVTG